MIDVDKFKALLAEGKELRQEHVPHRSHNLKNRRDVEKILRPLVTKAGLDVDEFNKMLALQQSSKRELFEKQTAQIARHATAQRKAFHHSIEEGYRATEYLGEAEGTLVACLAFRAAVHPNATKATSVPSFRPC